MNSSNDLSSIYNKSKHEEIPEKNQSVSSISNKYIKELAIAEGLSYTHIYIYKTKYMN